MPKCERFWAPVRSPKPFLFSARSNNMKMSSLKTLFLISLAVLFVASSCKEDDPVEPQPDKIQLFSVKIGGETLSSTELTHDIQTDEPIVARFSLPLDESTIDGNFTLVDDNNQEIGLEYFFLDDDKTVSATPAQVLEQDMIYTAILTEGILAKTGEVFPGLDFRFKTFKEPLTLQLATIDTFSLYGGQKIRNIDLNFTIRLEFSQPVDKTELEEAISVYGKGGEMEVAITHLDSDQKIYEIKNTIPADHLRQHRLLIRSSLTSIDDHIFEGLNKLFYTRLDETPKFPVVSDEELLTLVQEQTFKYFWDFGHPVSGLARERNTSGETVTSGGSGFGVMAILVGIERGFITREEGIARLIKIVDFLGEADRFHGAWSHWLNGTTGKVIPFSANDDGGDLVETSFMAMGLITVRQYLDNGNPDESELINKINTLLEGIEWDWYTQGGQDVLYWHWSPQFEWEKNHQIRGYNEALITYIMAASSTTHAIEEEVYHEGWARGGGQVNGNEYYGILLPLGPSFGGPLFFSHYTYLGTDPRNLTDQYANYWVEGINHTLINREHCIRNPFNYIGYSEECWGLTASDGDKGYSAHSPTNDRGVITPTAALSAFPYTPDESMDALKFFYYKIGDKLWGQYGFYDAFNITEAWTASSYIAIDQGPIILMIENHRTGLLWDLFMSAPEVQNGLDRLGFSY